MSFFFTKKKKNEKEVGNLRQVDRLSNGRRSTQSPMKLRALRSSVLCGRLRACQSLPHTADGASDSPTP